MTEYERIERQLHDAAAEVRVGTSVSSEVRRRINVRRLGTVTTGLVVAAGLVFGASFAAGAFTTERAKLGPAEETSEVLIEYSRSGGYEGSDARLTVDRRGDATLHYTQGADGLTVEGTLSQSELTDLEGAIAAVDWPTIDGPHDLPPGVGVADGYEYEIRHDDYVVTTISGAEPQEIKPLIELLDAVISDELAQQEPAEPAGCGPRVDFEPKYLPEGWISELQEGAALGKDPFGNIAGHYGAEGPPRGHRKMDAGFVDLVALGFRFEPPSNGDLIVLGQPAEFDEENGTIEFGFRGCAYALVGAGVGRDELVPFAEGLRPKGLGNESPAERCRSAVDFEPTYLPRDWDPELKPGEGGGGFFSGVLGHYTATASSATSDTQAGYVDLIAGLSPYRQSNKTVIRVLGDKALLGDIHEGFSVEFERGGCEFVLAAFGLDRSELRLFAEGLEEAP